MKRIMIISALAVACLMAAGCKEEQCEPYAPQGKEVSWTDYNTLDAVRDYFYCHRKTAEMHYGDTLKIEGFVPLYPNNKDMPFNYGSTVHGSYSIVHIGAKADVESNKQYNVIVQGDTSIMSCFRDYEFGQKVYMSVVIRRWGLDEDVCCDMLKCDVVDVVIDKEGGDE